MKVTVVGAGAMGRGIAQVSAVAGHDVLLFDVADGAAESALQSIGDSLTKSAATGRLSAHDAEQALARITTVDELSAASEADVIVEAIIEDLAIKQATFSELEETAKPDAVLASNTSSLAIGAIATGMADPNRLIGLHFFNPVPAMKLVEVVTRPGNDPATVQKAKDFVESIGKVGIEVLDSPGFLVNLAGRALNTEALAILRDNIATIDQVDRIAREVLGFRLGPFELMDLTGMDVNFPVTDNLFSHHFGDPRLRTTWIHRYLFEAGRLGRKSGGGFYSYDDAAETTSEEHTPPEDDRRLPRLAMAGSETLHNLVSSAGLEPSEDPELTLVDPLGQDLLTYSREHELPYPNVIGVDTSIPDPAVLTVMVPPGAPADAVEVAVEALESVAPVIIINESAGFIAQRLLAAVVNLGTVIAQYGIAAPADIDRAVELGLRYPHGPLAWGDQVGPQQIVRILDGIHDSTSDSRYEASTWLRRRAAAGISLLTNDHLPASGRHLAPRHGG